MVRLNFLLQYLLFITCVKADQTTPAYKQHLLADNEEIVESREEKTENIGSSIKSNDNLVLSTKFPIVSSTKKKEKPAIKTTSIIMKKITTPRPIISQSTIINRTVPEIVYTNSANVKSPLYQPPLKPLEPQIIPQSQYSPQYPQYPYSAQYNPYAYYSGSQYPVAQYPMAQYPGPEYPPIQYPAPAVQYSPPIYPLPQYPPQYVQPPEQNAQIADPTLTSPLASLVVAFNELLSFVEKADNISPKLNINIDKLLPDDVNKAMKENWTKLGENPMLGRTMDQYKIRRPSKSKKHSEEEDDNSLDDNDVIRNKEIFRYVKRKSDDRILINLKPGQILHKHTYYTVEDAQMNALKHEKQRFHDTDVKLYYIPS